MVSIQLKQDRFSLIDKTATILMMVNRTTVPCCLFSFYLPTVSLHKPINTTKGTRTDGRHLEFKLSRHASEHVRADDTGNEGLVQGPRFS